MRYRFSAFRSYLLSHKLVLKERGFRGTVRSCTSNCHPERSESPRYERFRGVERPCVFWHNVNDLRLSAAARS